MNKDVNENKANGNGNGIIAKEKVTKFGDKPGRKSGRFGKGKFGNGRGPNGSRGGKGSNYKGKACFNDISWYNKNQTITNAFAKLPFNQIVGIKIPGLTGVKLSMASIVSYLVDWVANLDSISTSTQYAQTILDQVKTIIYTDMRRANSGSTNQIEPIDVMTSNLIAAIDILCNSAYISRFFRIANSFSWKNRLIPRELFKHAGIDYDDFVANQANYRGRFDILVAYAKTIRVLAKYPFVYAAIAEFDRIFKDEDADTGREQIMMSVKAWHHIYDPVGTTTHPGGTIRLLTVQDAINAGIEQPTGSNVADTYVTIGDGTNVVKFSVLLNIFEHQIRMLIEDADFNLIQADLEKAFGDSSGYYETDLVREDVSPVTIEFNPEFRDMVHNGIFLKKPTITSGTKGSYSVFGVYENKIYQLPGGGGSGTRFGFENHIYYGDGAYETVCDDYIVGNGKYILGMIDSNQNEPGTDEVIITTRYKSCFRKVLGTGVPVDTQRRGGTPATDNYYRTINSSNFIVFGHLITTIRQETDDSLSVFTQDWYNVSNSLTRGIYMLTNLNHYPMILPYDSVLGSVPMFQLNNVRWVKEEELNGINNSCFLSLWNLPDKTNI